MSAISLRRGLALGGAILALGACGQQTPPPAPAPKPVVVTEPMRVPARPTPPDGAPATLQVPPLGADGLYVSVNRGISPAQITWNFRSAYNVAALNCPSPERDEITSGYIAFGKLHAKGIAAADHGVDAEYKAKYGPAATVRREAYMTSVYNHFASPPVMPAFCRAVLAVSRDGRTIKPAELTAFAARSLPSIEIAYDDFFRRYAQYQTDLAAWDARYAAAMPARAQH